MKQALALTTMAALAIAATGCASHAPQQADLDAWQGLPVEALDLHSLFIGMPQVRTRASSGVEIRDYMDKSSIGSCDAFSVGINHHYMSYGNFTALQSCTSRLLGCDNIFYIRDGKVLEYKPVGQCRIDDRYHPEPGWDRFLVK